MHVSGLQASVIRFALRFRGIVVALAVLLAAYGAYALSNAAYDVFPEFAPPQLGIQTEAPGLAAEQVEAIVTRPIETALAGVPGELRIQSSSIEGLSVVTIFFDPRSDIYLDRQLATERLEQVASELPAEVRAPRMSPLTSSTEFALVAGLTSRTRSLMQLRTIAEWTVRPSLLAAPGVANVELFGGETRATQILVHPEALIRFGIGMNDVLAAARQAAAVRGAGFISTPNQRITLRAEGQSPSSSEIARTVIARHGGVSVTLGDVADVIEAPEPAIGGGAIMGEPAVVMNITEQYGANTLKVTRGLDRAFAALQPALQKDGVVLHENIFRPGAFITTATDNLGVSLLIGAGLVVAVLFLFLSNFVSAAISCTAIPLSLMAAVVVLQRSGISLNIMTLGGLAIAIGEVVDDAVIGVENVMRRLRENGHLSEPRPAARVILEATFEVRTAVVYATFAVIVVFLPVVTLSGIAGRMFGPLGLTYITAVLASLIVSITVTPALSLLLLPRRIKEGEPTVMQWTRGRYEALLRRVARAPRSAIAIAAALTLAGLGLAPLFGATFLPELHEGHFTVHMIAMPGTSLTESMRMGARVTDVLASLPIVKTVAQRAGRAELTADTHGAHESEFEVDLKSLTGAQAESARTDILQALAEIPGPTFSANTFLTERIDETFSGYTSPVAVEVFGNNLDAINATAQKVEAVLRKILGATSVQAQSPPGLPQVAIRLRHEDLERWGLDPVQVLDVIRTAYQGDVVGQTYDGDRVFDVLVKLAPASGEDMATLGNLTIRSSDGTYVPLREVATVAPTSGLYEIQHLDGRRLATVTMDVEGRSVSDLVKEAQRRIAAEVSAPSGVYIEFAGAAEGQAQAQRDLALNAVFAAAGIVLLLSVTTGNWRNLLVVLANLPFALVGGIIAAFASGAVLSLGSLIGFVTLFGITLRNSMMMISHYEHLVEVDGLAWGIDAAIRGAADRLAPILMTSLVTGLGLLPLAIGMNTPGREIEGPMALVILGGLLTSMLLNLLVLPTLALRFGRFAPRIDEFEAAPEGPRALCDASPAGPSH